MTERKPNARWERLKRGELYMSCGDFSCHVYRLSPTESTYKWRIDSSGGDNRHAGGWSDTEENAQLAAEDALRKLLTEALAELDGG